MNTGFARVFPRCAPIGLGFALLLAAHCGGKVIINLDPDRLEQACQSTCEALAGCYALGQEQCVSGCRGASSACQASFIELLECLSRDMDTERCDVPAACDDPVKQWVDCEAWCLDEMTCEGSGAACTCDLDACGPTDHYDIDCAEAPSGNARCECRVDGLLVGACEDSTTRCDDDKKKPCCATLVFVSGH